MMPLASSGLEIGPAIVIAIIVGIWKLVSSVNSVSKSQPKPPPMPPQAGSRQGSIRASQEQHGHDSEEERTRKFLEALGLPPSTLQPKAAPDPMRGGNAPMRRPGSVPPIPPFVPERMRGGRGSIPHAVPEVTQPSRSQVETARLERKLHHAQQQARREPQPPVTAARAYDGAIERLHFAELKTPETPAFHTRTSDVSAIPFELADSVAGKLYMKEGTARQTELVALARSPKALRQAILLREILGPPRSLQSDFVSPNLAPL